MNFIQTAWQNEGGGNSYMPMEQAYQPSYLFHAYIMLPMMTSDANQDQTSCALN